MVCFEFYYNFVFGELIEVLLCIGEGGGINNVKEGGN